MKLLTLVPSILSIISIAHALSPLFKPTTSFLQQYDHLVQTPPRSSSSSFATPVPHMSTVVAPPSQDTKTNTRIGRGKSSFFGDQGGSSSTSSDNTINPGEISKRSDAPLEYLEDEWSTRNPEDPFHILLLDTTFTKNDRVTVSYVVGCLEYVLGMPSEEAKELTEMAVLNGLSCLGTWEREECLSLGRQLQMRDLAVRVVPYCEGGMRGWQMRNADANAGAGAGAGGIFGGSGFD